MLAERRLGRAPDSSGIPFSLPQNLYFFCLCESMLLFCCIWAHQWGAPSGRSFQAPPTSRGACFSASGGVQVLIALSFLLCCLLLLPLLPPLWTQTWPLDMFKNSPHLARALWEEPPRSGKMFSALQRPTHGNVAGRSNLNSLARLVKIHNSPADTAETGSKRKFGNCTLKYFKLSLLWLASEGTSTTLIWSL